jgi:hypothetical protein
MTDADVVEIDDDDDLYRHLRPGGHLKKNGQVAASACKTRAIDGGRDPVPDRQVSVDLARLTSLETTLPPSRRQGGCGVGQLKASVPRRLDLQVLHAPDSATANRAHSLILGMRPTDDGMAKCEKLALETRVLIMPTRPPPAKPPV